MYKNSQTKWSSVVHFVPFSKVSYFCLHLAAQVLIVLLQQTKKHSTGFICSRRQAVHKSRHISASKELNRILVRLSIWLYSPLCWLPETSKQCLTEVGDQWCGGFLLGLSAGTPSFRRGRIGSCYVILCLCSVSTSLPPAQILHTKQPLPPHGIESPIYFSTKRQREFPGCHKGKVVTFVKKFHTISIISFSGLWCLVCRILNFWVFVCQVTGAVCNHHWNNR